MRVRHPYALDEDAPDPDGTVHWGGRRDWSDVDEDGTFYVPDDRAENFVESWPTANGYGASDLLVAAGSGASDGSADETPDGSDSDGVDQSDDYNRVEIDAGRCPWCDDYEGDGVPQHASAAHPERWAAHTED